MAIEVLSTIKTVSNLPLVKINRENYLIKEFSTDYSHIMDDILEKGPFNAGVPIEIIEKKAKAAINFETNQATAISFALGLPGGFAMIGTIPADITQFMGNSLRIVQKLAYLSGMPGFSSVDDMTDDEANMVLIYLGVMFGEAQAVLALDLIAKHMAGVALKKIPATALTKVVGYTTIKSLLKAVGVKLTKKKLANFFSKSIPIASSFISGGLTFVTLKKMSYRLYEKLTEVRFKNN